jgi:hypothetical protein
MPTAPLDTVLVGAVAVQVTGLVPAGVPVVGPVVLRRRSRPIRAIGRRS